MWLTVDIRSQLVSQTVGGSIVWFTGIYQRRKLVVKMENHEEELWCLLMLVFFH